MGEVTQPNCNSWAVVDFGQGPVTIRCTQTGEHTDCMCVVLMGVEEPAAAETNGAEG
jgi:hypothetical protein